MPKNEEARICFVIAPIGPEGSDVRVRADQVLKHIISPAAKDCGYETIRADQISEPGLITSQVIQHVVEDPLVIADLTGRNPNVFYELAIRHAVKKPVVQIIHATESIPFDVAASRTVHVDHHDLDSASKARDEISRQIKAAERNPKEVDTPITVALELQSLRQSDNPLEKSSAEIISMLQEVRVVLTEMFVLTRDAVSQIREDPLRARFPSSVVEELMMFLAGVDAALEIEEGKEPSREQLENLRQQSRHSEQLLHLLAVQSGVSPEFLRRVKRERMKSKAE